MKRFWAFFISVTLSLSAAFTVSGDDKGLADAIASAKGYITVPADQTEVDYQISKGDEGNTIIDISWSGDNSSTFASIDLDGCLLSYNNDNYYEYTETGLSKYSGEDTVAVAQAFLKTVYGNNASSFHLEASVLNRYGHEYTFYIYQNGIKVSNGKAYITVDPNTCKVESFSGIGKEFFNVKYPSTQGSLSVTEAMRCFYGNTAPKPQYITYTTYENNKTNKFAFLAFKQYDTYSAVDAFTGEQTDLYRYFNTLSAKNASADDTAELASEVADTDFTSQELEAINNAEGLLTDKQAADIIKQYFPVARNTDFTSSKITKNNYTGDYSIRISGDSVSATLDAKTGTVKYFNMYDKDASKAEPISDEKASAIADSAVSKLAPNESKSIDKPVFTSSSYNGRKTATLYRIENGYICDSQYLSVTVNASEEIVGYNNSFDNQLTLPKPQNVLSEDAAIKALTETFDFSLSYTVDKGYNAHLVYCFNKSGLMDSTSAVKLDYKGKPVREEAEAGISDVKGHWAEKYITALYNNGYTISDSLFRPDQPITKEDLDELYTNYSYKPYYANDAEEADSSSTATITRYELAEYITDYYNLGKLKNHPEIFVLNCYKDEIDEKYKPTVAIATALGILNGDSSDSFNGCKTVTRAEAAVALYNILTTETD